MPTNTPRLKIPKPLGNEIVKRINFGDIWDALEQNAATRQEPELLSLDVFGTTGFVKSSTDFVATKNGVTPTQLDVTAGVAWLALAGGAGLRRFAQAVTNFTTVTPNTTYYLDAQPDGTYSWGTAHSVQAGYLALWEVTTDGAGQILAVTDRRVVGKGPKTQAAGTTITDAGNYFASADVEGALQEVGQPLNQAAPVNVLSNKTYLRAALEKIQNDRKVAQVPVITIQGSTVINLLGRDGNCEDLSKWTAIGNHSIALDNSNKTQGSNSLKITATGAGLGGTNQVKSIGNLPLKDNQKYAVVVDAKALAVVTLYCELFGTLGSVLNQNITTTWGTYVYKVVSSGSGSSKELYFWLNGATTAYIDAIRVIELTDAEYADANWQPPDYCESVQFLRNPTIRNNGKNLAPEPSPNNYRPGGPTTVVMAPQSEWYVDGNGKAWPTLKITKTDTASWGTAVSAGIPVDPTKSYTFTPVVKYSGVGDIYVYVKAEDKIGTNINENNLAFSNTTFQTVSVGQSAITSRDRVIIGLNINSTFNGTAWLACPMLEEGTAFTSYEKNRDETLVFALALASGEKIEYANGKAVVTEYWQKDIVLDGALSWVFNSDLAGFKRVQIPNSLLPGVLSGVLTHLPIKYDGKILVQADTNLASDRLVISSDGNTYISISDTDSGWDEAWTGATLAKATYTGLTRDATATDLIKAYFNGWKMINFGTPATTGWQSMFTAYQTWNVDYVINSYAPGFPGPYKLHYQLAQPRVYEILPQGGISLAEGVNQVEVKSGLVLGEKANPGLKSDYNQYYINYVGGDPATYNRLNYKTNKILCIYKNGKPDPAWTIRSDSVPYGKEMASIPTESYDPYATYTVDYEVLPEVHNTQKQTVTLTDNGSLRDSVNLLTRTITKVEKDVSSVLQELLRRVPSMVDRSLIKIRQTVAQSIPAATMSKIQYQITDADNKTEFDFINQRYMAKETGWYYVATAVGWDNMVSGNRHILDVYRNGSPYLRLFDNSAGGAYPIAAGSCLVYMRSGWYIEIYVWTANAYNTRPDSTNYHTSYLEIIKVS